MFSEKQKEVFAFLKKNEDRWVTSKELAAFCQCTTRSIRNHVAKINEGQPAAILTSNLGYQINSVISGAESELGEAADRKSKLFLELLKHSSQGVDLYELAEHLFISESTVKNDIQQLKKEITDQAIYVIIENERIKLKGPERAKRKYMISLLYNEGDMQEKLRSSIQEMIGYISLEELQKTIRGVLEEYGIRTNHYSLNNIVLHFAISIERIRQGHLIKKRADWSNLQEKLEYQLAERIGLALSEQYDIHFSEPELEQLSLLFIGMQHETLANTAAGQLTEFVDERVIEVLQEVLRQVEELYLITLDNQEFFNKLAIHVQSLYYRSHYETFTRNSSLLDIKTAYPLIYDLSVYISSLIQDKLNIWFNDDEISFIALHIGAFLETQKEKPLEMVILLVMNDYHDIRAAMVDKIKERLGPDVGVVIGEKQEVAGKNYDILLTTDKQIALDYSGAVLVHPFLTEKDLVKIEKRIAAKKRVDAKKQMYRYIDRFITEKTYFSQVDPAELTPAEIRKQLTQRMIEAEYVDAEFYKNVEKRERLSPTSFPSGIAIPHSVELDALKSGVAIMTLQEPILWADYPVRLIALVGINKEEAKTFNAFFEKFIEIVSEPVHTKQLSQAEDSSEFILKLKMLVEEE